MGGIPGRGRYLWRRRPGFPCRTRSMLWAALRSVSAPCTRSDSSTRLPAPYPSLEHQFNLVLCCHNKEPGKISCSGFHTPFLRLAVEKVCCMQIQDFKGARPENQNLDRKALVSPQHAVVIFLLVNKTVWAPRRVPCICECT